MVRNIILPVIFAVLAYGFWISPDFKEISAGVAIFLFGMLSLEEGFKAFTGGLLERLLKRTTDKLWKSLTFGIVSTTLMQSSSLVSVITISFLSAGLISLVAGIGIIFGANLGTTTGAWLVAGFGLKVKISAYAMPMIVFGVILVFQKSPKLKGAGYILAGLGFLFLGIHYMKEGFEAFKSSIDLAAYAVDGYKGVMLFTLIGMVATVVMQSSHATLVLIITALAARQVTYENALALAIGANLGTTITAVIGSLGSNVDGRRLAGAHMIFNLATAAVSIGFIYQLTDLVDQASAYLGVAADDYTLKLAVFHTIFNTLGIVLMLPFINLLVRFLQAVMKPRARTVAQPRYLNEASKSLDDTALNAIRKELLHLYDNAYTVITRGLQLDESALRSDMPLDDVIKVSQSLEIIDIDEQYNTAIKSLHSDIIAYISEVRPSANKEVTDELFVLRNSGRHIIEAIKATKHLQKNLIRYASVDDEKVKQEYQDLRYQLAYTLREVEQIRAKADVVPVIVSLDELKVEMKAKDAQLDIELEDLIRQHKINPQQATSLMNDSGYACEIAKGLVKVGSALFLLEDIATNAAERDLALDDGDIDA